MQRIAQEIVTYGRFDFLDKKEPAACRSYSSDYSFCRIFTVFLGPRNYEDCILMVVKDAKSSGAACLGKRACEAKFPD